MPSNVKEALRRKGISTELVAQMLGLHRNTVANKLDGESSFTIEEAIKIKQHLLPEYDVDWLFATEED